MNLENLIMKYIDGELTIEEDNILRAYLKQDPLAKDLFDEYLEIHLNLKDDAETIVLPNSVAEKTQNIVMMKILNETNNYKHKENIRKVAFKRGPIVYCFESLVSRENIDPETIFVDTNNWITERFVNGNELGQYIEIEIKAEKYQYSNNENDLYSEKKPEGKPLSIILIPYYMWSNRGESYMAVWLNEKL